MSCISPRRPRAHTRSSRDERDADGHTLSVGGREPLPPLSDASRDARNNSSPGLDVGAGGRGAREARHSRNAHAVPEASAPSVRHRWRCSTRAYHHARPSTWLLLLWRSARAPAHANDATRGCRVRRALGNTTDSLSPYYEPICLPSAPVGAPVVVRAGPPRDELSSSGCFDFWRA